MASLPRETPLSQAGELAVVAALLERFHAEREDVLVGPGDDAAVLRIRRGHVVVSTDLVVENRHFRRDWCSAEDVGHRAAAQNLSDINAMGGRAHSLTLGLALPEDLTLGWVEDFATGFAAEAARVGAVVVGGDVTRASEIVAAVTVMGGVAKAPVLRSGAQPGDVLALCGRQGWAAAGLAVLGRGFRSPRVLVDAYRRPEPPYDAGAAAAEAGARALIDISDGLLSDAGHVAVASGVRLDVSTAALGVDEPLHAVGAALGADPQQFVLSGGDDHGLLAAFPADVPVPDGWTAIGRAHERGADDEPWVTVDGAPHDGPTGWRHF